MVTLNAGSVTATTIVDAPPTSAPAPATAFARSTSQVLNIVTAGGAAANSKATGGFFPVGLKRVVYLDQHLVTPSPVVDDRFASGTGLSCAFRFPVYCWWVCSLRMRRIR